MECNKDEAMRAKQIAESRMQEGDFIGALKFATKAKTLYADIENIAQMVTVCEVHCAAQKKLYGSHMDWYRILQTERFSDEATMKKQYKKLALLLHPDKNKFAGAEAAFKLIGEANWVLSDQTKRSLYDIKCRASVRTAAPKTSSRNKNGNAKPGQQSFWTSCKHCNTKHKYYKAFLNATLRCLKCLKSFTAHDLGCQGSPPGYTQTSSNNQKEASNHGRPKPAEKRNGGGHADKSVPSNPVSTGKCAAGVGGHCKGEQSKDGYVAREGAKGNVPASKDMDSRTSTNVGSKRVRLSGPDSPIHEEVLKLEMVMTCADV